MNKTNNRKVDARTPLHRLHKIETQYRTYTIPDNTFLTLTCPMMQILERSLYLNTFQGKTLEGYTSR